jgi:hypothetical protein
MPITNEIRDNSSSFFKYQMRVITSLQRPNETDVYEPRCDAERRRGEP